MWHFSDAQIAIHVKTGYMLDVLALIVIDSHRSTCVFSAPEQPRTSEEVEYVNLRELRMPFRVRLWHTNHNAIGRGLSYNGSPSVYYMTDYLTLYMPVM